MRCKRCKLSRISILLNSLNNFPLSESLPCTRPQTFLSHSIHTITPTYPQQPTTHSHPTHVNNTPHPPQVCNTPPNTIHQQSARLNYPKNHVAHTRQAAIPQLPTHRRHFNTCVYPLCCYYPVPLT